MKIKGKMGTFEALRKVPHFYMIRTIESILMTDYLKGAKGPLLDIGCANGFFATTLGVGKAYGIDIDEDAVVAANKNARYVEVKLASATDIPFTNNHFGTVFSNCAVEHMDNLNRVIKEVNRVLKKGGKFIFTVPTRDFMRILKEDKVLKKVGFETDESLDRYNDIHHHVNIIDPEKWKKNLMDGEFKVLKNEYYLPEPLGSFVVRMDVLYTLGIPIHKKLIRKLEAKYRFLLWSPVRKYFNNYIKNPHCGEEGTHMIFMAEKI